MVRNYKRKTDRGIWEEDDMSRAVRAVRNETMGFLRASATYNVPKSTLERRVRKARCAEDADTDSDNDYGKKKLGRYKTVFNKEQEEELSQYIKSMEARLFGITGKELRILAFQLAERNHIENPFNAETRMAGEDWLSGFLKRHPELSFRRPEPTSAARAMAFNKVAVNEFLPKEVRTQKRKIRKRGKTAILTASPYKNDLIKDMNKKQKINKTTDKKKLGNKKTEKKRPEKKKPEKKNKNKRHKKQSDTESSSVDDENDCPCIYCGYLYSQSTEGWVICSVCYGWAHNSCAGVDDDDEEAHICERCQPD